MSQNKIECTHSVVTEEESWQTGGVTVTCERCRKLIPFDEWKNSQDGLSALPSISEKD